jgi:C-terminal processing protease CtpA/Prc
VVAKHAIAKPSGVKTRSYQAFDVKPKGLTRLEVVLQQLLVVTALALAVPAVWAQDIKQDREVGIQMLEGVASRIKNDYYDPNLRGFNWEAAYAQTEQRIRNARSAQEIAWHIYMLVRSLNDSHTVFLPPSTSVTYEYGLTPKFLGDKLYIYELENKGAAEKAGLKVGDRIVSILLWGQPVVFAGTRKVRPSEELVLLLALYLAPPPELGFRVVSPGETTPRFVNVKGKEKAEFIFKDIHHVANVWEFRRAYENWRKENRFELGGLAQRKGTGSGELSPGEPAPSAQARLGYLKMPHFVIDKGFGRRLVKELTEYEALIIDLRGNPGGAVDGLLSFMGFFEPAQVEIGQEVGRKKSEPLVVKPQKPHFGGPLVVLTDSDTGSAAEVFARHFQRTGRAKVVGDQSSGAVVIAKTHIQKVGFQYYYVYGIQVSVAQLVLPGGESLEGAGVTPDYVVLPTGEDLAKERDPVLAKAAEVALEMLRPKQEQAAGEK